MARSDAQLLKMTKKLSNSELMRVMRLRQLADQSPAKRSATAKKAAEVRWAREKGKDILDEEKKK